jgi:isoquinoline 1-oxidoreductase beta subunit
MNTDVLSADISRRGFLGSSAAAAGSLVVGFHLPGLAQSTAQNTAQGVARDELPELNAWVVVRPDDKVIIRIARSEMGQGTMTGLAQLVAEELDCDWARVMTEYPTPGQTR